MRKGKEVWDERNKNIDFIHVVKEIKKISFMQWKEIKIKISFML